MTEQQRAIAKKGPSKAPQQTLTGMLKEYEQTLFKGQNSNTVYQDDKTGKWIGLIPKAHTRWSCTAGKGSCTLRSLLVKGGIETPTSSVLGEEDYSFKMDTLSYIEAKRLLVDFHLILQIHHKSFCPGFNTDRLQNLSRVGTDCEKLSQKRMVLFELGEQEQFDEGASVIVERITAFYAWLNNYERRRAAATKVFNEDANKTLYNLNLTTMSLIARPREFKPDPQDRKTQKPKFSIEM